MSSGQEETQASELVIIRRRGSGEDAPHKGGVWKIAYADFMTAMMAFFLVMWLINSTDRQTLTQVATYFNPLRLTDKVPTPKGLYEQDSGALGKSNKYGNSKEPDGKAKSDYEAEAGKPKYTEEVLFKDPFGVLARLAQEARDEQQIEHGDKGEARLASGQSFRDPFDPAFRREALKNQRDSQVTEPQAVPAKETVAAGDIAKESAPNDAVEPAEATESSPPQPADASEAQVAEMQPVEKSTPQAPAEPVQEPADRKDEQASTERADQAAQEAREAQEAAAQAEAQKAAQEAERAKLDEEIKQALAQSSPDKLPHIEVTVTDEGLLISLTDEFNFGMFAIASAEPRPELVVVMEKVAKILTARSEPLVVRGHTDGRPYKSGTYDNWRLSTARAHMAYYMLVRGGIGEKRFERIEGYADRSLRVADDPEAAQNRRIELLLRKEKS